MISFDNLSAGYGSRDVLQGVSAKADAGDFIALLGPNGSGKSTLLKTLTGIISPASGHITMQGQDLSTLKLKTRARNIAYLAQSREAAPAMTVNDVVRLGRAPYRGALGRISEDGEAAIHSSLARTQSTDFIDRRFDSLSGGEQARVLLARALAVGAPVLLADEPIAALDPFYQLTMMEILKAEAASGKTVIAALHDLPLAAQFASRVWIMQEGKIVANGPPVTALTDKVLKYVFNIKAPKGGFKALELSN